MRLMSLLKAKYRNPLGLYFSCIIISLEILHRSKLLTVVVFCNLCFLHVLIQSVCKSLSCFNNWFSWHKCLNVTFQPLRLKWIKITLWTFVHACKTKNMQHQKDKNNKNMWISFSWLLNYPRRPSPFCRWYSRRWSIFVQVFKINELNWTNPESFFVKLSDLTGRTWWLFLHFCSLLKGGREQLFHVYENIRQEKTK